MADELVEDLEEKREKAYKEAMKHRKRRDALNEEAKKWANRRDELNKKARAIAKEGIQHKERRNELNEKVKETKVLRDEWNKKYRDAERAVKKLKKEKMPEGGVSIGKLKAQLKALEFKQMTQVMTKEKEQEIIELLGNIQKKIEEVEKSLEDSKEIQEASKKAEEIKEKAEEYHQLVSKYADGAQEEHEKMVALFEEADKLRQEADEAQEKFIEAKLKSDEEHRMFTEEMKRVYDFEKVIAGLRHKRSGGRGGSEHNDNMERAKEIYEKFKNGEKLSTEDLMLLQKSGFL